MHTARDEVPGNVRLLFQPAEEGVRGGGAKVMVEEGVLDGVREVYGLHNWPGFPKGEVRVCGGPLMAQVDNVTTFGRNVGPMIQQATERRPARLLTPKRTGCPDFS